MIKLRNWLRNRKAQGMVEYALIVALISIVAIAVMRSIGTQVNTKLSSVNSALT